MYRAKIFAVDEISTTAKFLELFAVNDISIFAKFRVKISTERNFSLSMKFQLLRNYRITYIQIETFRS